MPKQSIPHWGWRLNGRTLYRDLDGSRHFLRVPPAIAFDAAAYDELRDDFDNIEVLDRSAGRRYRISADSFDAHRGIANRGFGIQYFVTFKHWNSGGSTQLALAM